MLSRFCMGRMVRYFRSWKSAGLGRERERSREADDEGQHSGQGTRRPLVRGLSRAPGLRDLQHGRYSARVWRGKSAPQLSELVHINTTPDTEADRAEHRRGEASGSYRHRVLPAIRLRGVPPRRRHAVCQLVGQGRKEWARRGSIMVRQNFGRASGVERGTLESIYPCSTSGL